MKKIFEALAKFIVGFITAFIISDKWNWVFHWFNLLNISNINLQNSLISLSVTLFVTLVVEFFKMIIEFFSPMSIKIETDKNIICFKPKFSEYKPQKEKFVCTINPGSRITMWILKRLNATLVLSFNPESLTIGIENDPNWSLEDANTLSNEFRMESRRIIFCFLNNYNVSLVNSNQYKTSVCIEIRPDIVKEQTVVLNYGWNGYLKKIISLLCKVELCKFKCEGKNE